VHLVCAGLPLQLLGVLRSLAIVWRDATGLQRYR
jgi:hypothetical protein